MSSLAIDIENLVHSYGSSDAVQGLSLKVSQGQCYGFFGRNGAGKTTTIKCLLNLLRPTSGQVRVFDLDPQRFETQVKTRVAYVPDYVNFYPWMSVREALDYQASFRKSWNHSTEIGLLDRFQLNPDQGTHGLSKGQRTQLALIGAICADPDLLILDEPTSGLDPLVRREFIQTVIGAFQEAAPGQRTVFLSTHLISEFEGLIDRFTIIDRGRELVTLDADEARTKHRRIRATFAQAAPSADFFPNAKSVRCDGRTLDLVSIGDEDAMVAKINQFEPTGMSIESLTLEEIFLTTVTST